MKNIYLYFILLFFPIVALGNFKIRGRVLELPEKNSHLYIYALNNLLDNGVLIDSFQIDLKGRFSITIPSYFNKGSLFKIAIKELSENIQFPDNSLLISNIGLNTINIEFKNSGELYKPKIINASSDNRAIFKMHYIFEEYFNLLNKHVNQNQIVGRVDLMKEVLNIQSKFSTYLIHILKNSNSPVVNLAAAYFFYFSEINNADTDIRSKTFKDSLIHSKKFPENYLATALVNNYSKKYIKFEDGLLLSIKILDSMDEIVIQENLLVKEYTIVDFWASWCMPCRKANKRELPAFINEIKNSAQFGFLSLSIDTDKTNWLRAIKEDAVFWKTYKVDNLNKTILPKFLNGTGIPFYFICNKVGDVIYSANSLTEIQLKLKTL